MLYAKILFCGKADFTHASNEFLIVSGNKFHFKYEEGTNKPILVVESKSSKEEIPLCGDVFIMSSYGKTLSEFAVPLSFLGKSSIGWKDDPRVNPTVVEA